MGSIYWYHSSTRQLFHPPFTTHYMCLKYIKGDGIVRGLSNIYGQLDIGESLTSSYATVSVAMGTTRVRCLRNDIPPLFICPTKIIKNHSFPYKFNNNYCSAVMNEKTVKHINYNNSLIYINVIILYINVN